MPGCVVCATLPDVVGCWIAIPPDLNKNHEDPGRPPIMGVNISFHRRSAMISMLPLRKCNGASSPNTTSSKILLLLALVEMAAICCHAQAVKPAAGVEPSRQAAKEPVDISDDPTFTELTRAVVRRQVAVIRFLLLNGANVDGFDHRRFTMTPILVAAEMGDVEMLKLLCDAGAHLETRDDFGSTALNIAALSGRIKAVEFLLSRGADVNSKADRGDTALMVASRDGRTALVKILLKARADVNIATETGATALMVAADDADLVELLLNAGAKIDAVDKKGWTAMCYARKEKQSNKLKVLLAHGADNQSCVEIDRFNYEF
jgi:ankyrin repeat protein